MNFDQSKALQKKAHRLIPGGSHTYAKGDDQYPFNAPSFIARGKGCRVWDVDGNEFIEYGMGLRAVTLGHTYEPVVAAAYRQMLLGSNFTRPAAIEVAYAEELLELFEGAEMVKFAKNGSDVTTAAVKLARAYTDRDKIAICADHPFFSTDDWFIGTTPMDAGIPTSIKDFTVKFYYNDLESLKEAFTANPDQIAGVILEPATTEEPRNNFLHEIKNLCHKYGAVFILDEMITGFRWHLSGAQKYYGIEPDLSAFGKAIANGFSLSALVGKNEIMQLGGLRHERERVFLLSTTHGAETIAIAAAQETLNVYKKENVIDFLNQQGCKLADGINAAIDAHHLRDHFAILGKPCNLVYAAKDQEKNHSQAFRTLFLQEMIKRGFIMPSLVVSFSHTDAIITRTVEAIHESLAVYKQALENGVEKYLTGRPVKPVFRRYN
ncbi:glutamate-1-semialdehyde 2,1-aminomutase [candidate division KSB1 bacterium]|nr:MAG: glutamate-1-semialdehyde 2,1-aminomutase [candidate division KSB1 bacterium]